MKLSDQARTLAKRVARRGLSREDAALVVLMLAQLAERLDQVTGPESIETVSRTLTATRR